MFTEREIIDAYHAENPGQPLCLDRLGEARRASTMADAITILYLDTMYWEGRT